MGEKVQFNMRIEPELKEEIEEYVAESTEYISVTGFIRAAVNAKLKDSENPTGHPSPAIHSEVSDVQDELERIRKDVTWLRSQQQDATEITDLATQVQEELVVLPTPSGQVEVPDDTDMDDKEYRQVLAAESVILPDDTEEANKEGLNKQTLSAIASEVGATSEEVKDAIERLKEDFIPIVEVEREDKDGNKEIHYFLEK